MANIIQMFSSRVNWLSAIGVSLLLVPLIAFSAYSLRFGLRGLGVDLSEETYIFTPDGTLPNVAIFSHMILGAIAMVLAPLQLSSRLRMRLPALHRVSGQLIIFSATLIALGGLVYIAVRGTIAGWLMDVGFALYGLLMLGAALQAFRFARKADFQRHREWALRLFVLIMGSLIFRLHYALWYLLTGGVASNEQLTGPFDQVQYFAFYLPYLVLVELWIRKRPQVPVRVQSSPLTGPDR